MGSITMDYSLMKHDLKCSVFERIPKGFELDLFISVSWRVPQDLCNRDIQKLAKFGLNPPREGRDTVIVYELMKEFWSPDIFIQEAKQVTMSSKVSQGLSTSKMKTLAAACA